MAKRTCLPKDANAFAFIVLAPFKIIFMSSLSLSLHTHFQQFLEYISLFILTKYNLSYPLSSFPVIFSSSDSIRFMFLSQFLLGFPLCLFPCILVSNTCLRIYRCSFSQSTISAILCLSFLPVIQYSSCSYTSFSLVFPLCLFL